MASTRAAIRYSKAILDLAKSNGKGEAVLSDMRDIVATLLESKELRLLLQSPVVKGADKKNILNEIFKDSDTHTNELLNILVTNKRTNLLGLVAENYIDLYNRQQGVQIAKVISAIPLNEALKEKVLAKVKDLTGSSDVHIDNEVDESIIGGFILRVGDLQYNASIANQLGKLKREFSNSI